MPYFYVKVRKNIDICNFLNGYYCRFYGVRGLFQCPLKRGGPVCPHLECSVGGCNIWKNSKRRMYNIVFLYNYAVHLLYGKSWDGYGFYCLLKQVEIDVQSTSNRKLPNFYEKVTDFLSESYRISKWWQNSVLTEAWRDCHNQRVLTYYINWIFIQDMRSFMHSFL